MCVASTAVAMQVVAVQSLRAVCANSRAAAHLDQRLNSRAPSGNLRVEVRCSQGRSSRAACAALMKKAGHRLSCSRRGPCSDLAAQTVWTTMILNRIHLSCIQRGRPACKSK